ncbi:MAG: VTC domain-containing protein [Proteobacteria bacterium]|nr:VTC domain-containing protein [Pseudomonadota bacterium]
MRVEYKYLVTQQRAMELEDIFHHILIQDRHSLNSAYYVSSVYYDTKDLSYYHEKIEGEFLHRKARLRTYYSSGKKGDSYFEVKYKYHDDGYKQRIKIDKKMAQTSLLQLGHEMQSHYPQITYILGNEPIFPICHVGYRRQAYYLNIHQHTVRINIDSHICLLSENMENKDDTDDFIFPNHQAIVEVKMPHRGFSEHISELLKMIGTRRETFSKYISCLNTFYSHYKMETPSEF